MRKYNVDDFFIVYQEHLQLPDRKNEWDKHKKLDIWRILIVSDTKWEIVQGSHNTTIFLIIPNWNESISCLWKACICNLQALSGAHLHCKLKSAKIGGRIREKSNWNERLCERITWSIDNHWRHMQLLSHCDCSSRNCEKVNSFTNSLSLFLIPINIVSSACMKMAAAQPNARIIMLLYTL